MKTSLCLISALLFCVFPVLPQDDVGSIRNFVRVNEQFCTGGQPRLEHLAKLKAEGVKAIINLRRPTEHRADEEEAKAKELGLRYFNIPVVYGEPKDEQATEFLKITDDPAVKAFVDYYLSDTGVIDAVQQTGYVELPSDQIQVSRSTWSDASGGSGGSGDPGGSGSSGATSAT